MHRADPFMLDEEIAESDEPLARRTPPATPAKQPEPQDRQARKETVTPAPKPAPTPTPATKGKRGRPKSANPKRQITLRLDAEIIEHYRAKGRGWQTRINSALRDAAGINRSNK